MDEMSSSVKKTISLLLVILLFWAPVYSCSASATEISLGVDVTAEAAYIVNTNTGRVVYQKNATKQMYPASCTKIMTAALALEMCPDPMNTIVTVPNGVWNEFDGINISNAGLAGSEEMTMYDLICCMLLQSANEAASTVAHFYGRDDFISKMNMKARYLGCTGTNFVNPHGLYNAEHYTTAEDLYKITEWAMTVPYFMEIASMARYTLPVPPLAMWRMISYPATRVPAGSSFCRPAAVRTSPQWLQVIFPCGSASDTMVHPQLLQIYSAMSSGLRAVRAYRIPLVEGMPFSFGSCDTACSSALASPLKTASKI